MFATHESRYQHQDELDKLVEVWTIEHDHYEIMNTLQKVGVTAGAVFTSAELLADIHLKERGTFQTVDRAIVGPHPYPVPLAPERLSRCPISIRRPAPLLGEHNNHVLRLILGISQEEMQSLIDDQIIGTHPLGV
jgi:crotonobetainyl-CoA:carnitine CoA-transferase CaiB-like acyl-CoA transferase